MIHQSRDQNDGTPVHKSEVLTRRKANLLVPRSSPPSQIQVPYSLEVTTSNFEHSLLRVALSFSCVPLDKRTQLQKPPPQYKYHTVHLESTALW